MKMASENETIADIVAEMRLKDTQMFGYEGTVTMHVKTWRKYADRIEAAWNRERAKIATYAATQGVNLTTEKYANTPVGNAAAMRETIEGIRDQLLLLSFRPEGASEEVGAIARLVGQSLDTPPRNCDRYKDADSAYIAFCGYDFATKDISDDAFIDWLFAPAAEREGGGDGR